MNKLIIKTKRKVFGSQLGNNTSTFKGNGLNFSELREYNYGEDAKRIDWKKSAKLGKPLIKEFDEDRELNIIIAVLVSGGLMFGTARLKKELVAELVGLIGFSAVKNQDKVRLLFSDRTYFKPTKNVKKVYPFIEKSYNLDCLGEDYDNDFIDFLNKFQKGILFLIGDFYKLLDFHKLKHETYALIVRDRFEENLEELGKITMVDSVTLREVEVNLTKKNVKEYRKFIEARDRETFEYFKRHKIKFTKIYTDEEPFLRLMELLK